MSINNSEYQEPYVSLLSDDTLNMVDYNTDVVVESTTKTVSTTDSDDDSKPNRPYGVMVTGLFVLAILVVLCVNYINRGADSIYFTYPELSTEGGRDTVRTYYKTSFNDDVDLLTDQFIQAIKALPPTEDTRSRLVILDLDETLLDNYEVLDKMDFGFDDAVYTEWVNSAKAPAIKGTLRLLEFLDEQQIKFAFLTGRHEHEREATAQNLVNIGVPAERHVGLHLRRDGAEKHLTASEFKMNRRREIAEEYNIVGCAGDQNSDCAGSFTGLRHKLPNPIYLIN